MLTQNTYLENQLASLHVYYRFLSPTSSIWFDLAYFVEGMLSSRGIALITSKPRQNREQTKHTCTKHVT